MTCNIPMTVEEMTYSQFLDMKAAEKNHSGDFRNVIIESIIPYLKDPNDAYDMPFGEDKEDAQYRPLVVGDDITATGLYLHLLYLIETYKGRVKDKDLIYEFEHKGEKYQVNERGIKALSGMAFTVGEVVEVLQYQKLYTDMQRQFEKQNEMQTGQTGIFDLDCAMEFKLGLQEIAVLARKKDEKLPVIKREKDAFIVERMQVFQDLPMSIVLDIRFFLLSGLKKLAATQITASIFGDVSGLVKTKQKKKQSQRAKPKRLKLLG